MIQLDMPKKGQYSTHCAYGHDLTVPGARAKPNPKKRGLGSCRQCVNERNRVKRGIFKTGPVNRFRVNDARREAAEAAGLRWCTRCKQGKADADFNSDKRGPNGLSHYCRECRREMKAEAYERDREKILLQKQAQTFGVTVQFLLDLRDRHGGVCGICRNPCISGRALAVDHDHATGQIRGLLCANCNRALGLLQDSPQVVASAHAYLARWKASADASSDEGVQPASMP